MARRRYKFSNKKHSVGGVISVGFALFAMVLVILAVNISFKARGEAGINVGMYALCSLIVAVFGFAVGMLSYRESERYYTFSFIGSLANGLIAIILILLLLVGI